MSYNAYRIVRLIVVLAFVAFILVLIALAPKSKNMQDCLNAGGSWHETTGNCIQK